MSSFCCVCPGSSLSLELLSFLVRFGYFDTLIYMHIGTARTNTPSSHPVRGHPATSALVSLSPFFRHRTAGLLRCFPFLHTVPDVPESQFPLRPRAGNLRPPSGTPVEDFCLVFGILPFASIGVVVVLFALPGYSLCCSCCVSLLYVLDRC